MSRDGLLAPGWRAERRRVNGLALHVVEAGPVDGPLVILLHGFPEFWWAWRHQIAPLAGAGFRVVAPDMRGYNGSDAPQEVAAYRLDLLAADVVALADALGAGRFHLVGHDWGAVVAWWVAATRPERVRGLVAMCGPHPDAWAGQALRHPTQALRSAYVGLFQLPWAPEAALRAFGFAGLKAMVRASAQAGTFAPEALEAYAEAWAHPGSLTAMLNYYRALRMRPAGPGPARVRPPTLIVWAEKDGFLERHLAEASLALCDDGRLVVEEGATHWLHLERAGRVNAEILGFLGPAHAPGARRLP